MNKKYFVNELIKELNCDETYARQVLDLYEENFIIGNKEKTIKLFVDKLNVSNEEAKNLYETCSKIVSSSLKNKILHPFKNKEN